MQVLHCTLEKMRVSPSLPILETAVILYMFTDGDIHKAIYDRLAQVVHMDGGI